MKKYQKHLIRGAFLTAMVTGLSGCSEFWCWPFDCSSDETSVGIDDSSNTPAATVTDTTQNETAPVTPGGATEFDLNKVVWLHTDVSGWPETKSMTVELGGGVICLNGSFLPPTCYTSNVSPLKTVGILCYVFCPLDCGVRWENTKSV